MSSQVVEVKKAGVLGIENLTGTIVCLNCKSGFRSVRSTVEHLRKVHKADSEVALRQSRKAFAGVNAILAAGNGSEFLEKYKAAPFDISGKGECGALPKLDGLEVFEGYRCSRCVKYLKSEKTLETHMRSTHDAGRDEIQRVLFKGTVPVQTLQGGKKQALFRVLADKIGSRVTPVLATQISCEQSLDEDSEEDQKGKLEEGKQNTLEGECCGEGEVELLRQLEIVSGLSTKVGEDRRMMNDFMDKSKLDLVLKDEDFGLKDAFELSSVAEERTVDEKGMIADAMKYLERIGQYERRLSPAVKKKLAMRTKGVFESVSVASAKRYGQSFGRLIISATRNISRLSEDARERVLAYQESQKLGRVEERLEKFHCLASKLCLDVRSLCEDPKVFYVRLFIACSSVKRCPGSGNFRYSVASEMSPLLAALQYAIGAVGIVELKRIGLSKEDSDEDMSVLEEQCTRVFDCLDVEKNTVSSYVRSLLNIVMVQLQMKTTDFRVVECTDDEYCLSVDGTHFSAQGQGKAITTWLDEVEKIMGNELLGAMRVPNSFEQQLECMCDSLTDRRVGFCFAEHEKNRCWMQKGMQAVVKQLLKGGSAEHEAIPRVLAQASKDGNETRDVTGVEVGGFIWSRRGVEQWLQRCGVVQELLWCSIHLSTACDARATEASLFQLRNSSSSQRHVLIVEGYVAIVTSYSKRRKLSGGDRPKTRFLDKRTGKMLLKYLMLLRPVEAMFVGALDGAEARTGHLEWLFVRRGDPYRASELSSMISENMRKVGVPLSFTQLRQHSAGLVRLLAAKAPSYLQRLVEEVAEVGHDLAGHSVDTADRNYGRSSWDVPGLGATELGRYRRWSFILHKAQGLEPCVREEKDMLEEGQGEMGLGLEEECKNRRVGNELGSNQSSARISRKRVQGDDADVGSLGRLPPLKQARCQSIEAEHLGGVQMSVLGVPKVSDGSIRWHSGLVTHGVKLLEPAPRDRSVTAMRYLPKLRKVLNCSSAMFKSQTQMDVVAAVHECRSDLLVIMPTGSGKTLCVLLPVVLEGEGRSTIFIVPLVALREELLERAKRMGLSVGTWENREEKGYCQVYIFSVEHVDSKKFREFVRILIDMGRLARIVVDEVHLTLAWGEFRPVLSRLRHMLRAVNSPVQRVLLSATVPPCDRVNTLRAHGLQWAVLHWMPTVRRNLSFQVEKVDVIRVGGKFLSAEASLVEAAVQKGISAVGGFVERGEVGRVMIIGLKKECVGRIVEGLAKGFVDDEKRAENRGENVGQGVVHSKKVVDVMQYHGGLDKGVRKEVHSVWNMDDRKSKIIVCTSAFGTGVDVENVRVVVHVGGCCSLVQYAQEVGRAGRDGKRAKCIVLYNGKYAAWFMRTMESEYGVKGGAGFREGGIQESQAVAFSEFTQWAENEKVCRRNSLYGFLDGVEPGLCVFDEKSVLCDVCEVLNERAVGAFAVEEEQGGMGGEVGDGAVIRQSEVNSEEREVQCEGGGGGDRNVPVSFVTRRMESGVGSGGEEMGTVEVNKSFARDVEKREDKILEKLRSLARRWMGICMRCLAIRMREMKVGGCSCVGKFYCYRCQCTGHAVRNCRIESKQKDKCYRCWMNFCCGERIHDSGFGCAECPFQHLRALAWNLWRCRESRVGMLEEVCSKEEREKLKACAGDQVFYNWLMKQSEVPVIVRLSLWWEGKLRGEEVEISGRAEK